MSRALTELSSDLADRCQQWAQLFNNKQHPTAVADENAGGIPTGVQELRELVRIHSDIQQQLSLDHQLVGDANRNAMDVDGEDAEQRCRESASAAAAARQKVLDGFLTQLDDVAQLLAEVRADH